MKWYRVRNAGAVEGSGNRVEGSPPANLAEGTGKSSVPIATGPVSFGFASKVAMAMSSLRTSSRGDVLGLQLALVRHMLGRLETKLRENDSDRIPKEDDQGLRDALRGIGDERLTRFTLGYAVCVKGLTAPLTSGAWKRELAEEVDEAHRRTLARLETLERRTRSFVGRLALRLQARLRQTPFKSRPLHRPPSPEEDGKLHRRA